MAVTPDEFRDAMRRWGSGVSVVTTAAPHGALGITVSSFCSVSLDPPLVLVCISKSAQSHAAIAREGAFAVNVLREDQKALAERAAGRAGARGNRLEGIERAAAATGAPVLRDCLAWLDCSLFAAYPGGDHTIYVGRVEAAGHGDGRPLLWFRSDYATLGRRG